MRQRLLEQTVAEFLHDGRFASVPGALDEAPPWILRKLIPILSSRVVVDDVVVKKLKELAQKGPLIYAMKYRSMFDLQFLRMRFSQLGLPLPSFVFGVSPGEIGSLSKWMKVQRGRVAGTFGGDASKPAPEEEAVQEILEKGGIGVFFLVDEKTSRDRYVHPDRDPIRILLDLQGRMAASIAVVPMLILYDRTQRRTIRPFWESFMGDPDLPGPVKRILIALRKWTVPELLIGEPAYLVGEFEEFGSETSWEELPFKVRQELIASINARVRVNRGPERLSRTEIKELVLQDRRVQRGVREAMSSESATEEKLRRTAEAYVQEIAGDQHIQIHHFLFYILKWLFARVFDGIDIRKSDFTVLKDKNQQGALIYVSSHKSHFDYLLIGYLSFINQMAIPYMAAGKNLSFWPLGPVLRNAGAFFIRRSFKGMSLYPHVFAGYLKVLLKEKININFYIEGGRSRTGKLMPPRVGMLAFLLQTLEEEEIDDLLFVPTFIGYDQIPEEDSYLRELSGREKQKESLFSMIRAREVLKKRFGKVYVRFQEPVSYKAFLELYGQMDERVRSSVKSNRRLLNDFAYYLMSGVVQKGVVTPIDLVAAGLMCVSKPRIDHAALTDAVRWFAEALVHEGVELAESLDRMDSALETALGLFRVRGFIDVAAKEASTDATTYVIDDEKRANLDFYRNSLVNYLWPSSMLSTAFLRGKPGETRSSEDLTRDFLFLKDLCQKELILDPLVDPKEILDRTLAFFKHKGWVEETETQRWEILDPRPLTCFKGILADLLGLYCIVLATSGGLEGRVSQKDFIKNMRKAAADMHLEEQGLSEPVPSSIATGNALAKFHEMGIFEYRQGRKVLVAVVDQAKRDDVKHFLARSLNWNIDGGNSST